ncbi:MAG: hypothetical protein JO218_01860 [Burkholderiales bacterium]|nr:hypothetical protein [Burkholderiales bacterium]
MLWPEKEKDVLSEAIAAALSANMAFAAGVLRTTVDGLANIDHIRREAGVASSRAEIARQRMLLQGQSQAARLEHVHDILVALHTICGAANTLAISRQFQHGSDDNDTARANGYDALLSTLRAEMIGNKVQASVGSPDAAAGSDDLDRAVQALALAVKDYAADACTSGTQPM